MKNRWIEFIIKFLSIKIILWYIPTTIFFVMGYISVTMWLLVSAMVFIPRQATKIIMKYLEGRKGE